MITRMSILPSYQLKRHPLAVAAHFDYVIVLTYAFPAKLLLPLVSPGLVLDTYRPGGKEGGHLADEELAFVAVAAVRTEHMRPRGLPAFLGQDYMLIGYRIFVRYQTLAGQRLRGLQILRSDVNSNLVVRSGNIMTHYNFHKALIRSHRSQEKIQLYSSTTDKNDLSLSITTPPIKTIDAQNSQAMADPASGSLLPAGSPFPTVREALKFAGPMPFTFDYEKETNSIIRVEGVREQWHPQPVSAEVEKIDFFKQSPFNETTPKLCSAFYTADVPYYWKRGIAEILPKSQSPATKLKV